MELHVHFEKEAVIKKKVLEKEAELEDLAFRLFKSEMDLNKLKWDGYDDKATKKELEVWELKDKITEISHAKN